jgi:malonyl-CoA O-methyltransferase
VALNKQEISKRFSIASTTYEQEALVQKEAAQLLVDLLLDGYKFKYSGSFVNPATSLGTDGFYPSSILDVGTGTGYIPRLLMRVFPESTYTLNDISSKMLEKAMEKFRGDQRCTFCLGDIESVPFGYHDLIISNLALQWVEQLEVMLDKFYSLSKVMAFSCLSERTFEEWDELLKKYGGPSPIRKYADPEYIEAYLQSLKGSICFFRRAQFRLQFRGAKSFMRYLKNLGASVGENTVPLHTMKRLIEDIRDSFDVTYNLFFAVVMKKE